ncbi:MAG: hypothetical protein EXS10_02275 [Phycisphaerales bacterium]|nr:hypothetical protein [Phycisphaerales bacterium]
MRFRRVSSERDRKPEINLAAMIDATFLLLSYFIFTQSASSREAQLDPNLATQRGSERRTDLEPQNVDVLEEGGVRLYRIGGATYMDKASLTEALRALNPEDSVFVRVRDGVDFGFAATAVQAAHDAGYTSVTYVPFH